jgi:excisionase family DNA binding protein
VSERAVDPPFYYEGALVPGRPALVIACILRRHWDDVEDLPPHIRADLEASVTALEYAAKCWRSKARGRAEVASAEVVPDSSQDVLTAGQVAAVLKVTDRRVRQLAAAGQLPGRRDRAGRRFDRAAVMAHKERTTGGGNEHQ